MSNSNCAAHVAGGLGLGALAAAVGAGCTAFAGWAGAKILDSSGYTDYDADTSAATAAIGGAVITGAIGLMAYPLMVSSRSSSSSKSKPKASSGVVAYTADIVISSMVGQAIQSAAGNATLEFGKQMAASAVGAAVTMIPAACGVVCIGGSVVACVVGGAEKKQAKQLKQLQQAVAEAQAIRAATLRGVTVEVKQEAVSAPVATTVAASVGVGSNPVPKGKESAVTAELAAV